MNTKLTMTIIYTSLFRRLKKKEPSSDVLHTRSNHCRAATRKCVHGTLILRARALRPWIPRRSRFSATDRSGARSAPRHARSRPKPRARSRGDWSPCRTSRHATNQFRVRPRGLAGGKVRKKHTSRQEHYESHTFSLFASIAQFSHPARKSWPSSATKSKRLGDRDSAEPAE